MTTLTIAELLKYANLQMAAEAFLVDGNGTVKIGSDLKAALIAGNNHASKFTSIQAEIFLAHWEVVAQQPNTSTGFSGTLFRNKDTNKLVMSFRSTEFIDDAARDNQSTNSLEIKETGFAWGQIRDMQAWYQQLTGADGPLSAGQTFSVTGYSLGGHLATVFNLLYTKETETVTFNGAGIGAIDTNTTLGSLVTTFTTLSANVDGNAFTFTNGSLTDLYARARTAYKAGGSISAADRATLISLANPPAESSIAADAQAKMVLDAINRIDTIRAEVTRLTSITSGDGGSPVQVPNGSIGQEDLDYQMAVLTVSASTDAASILDGLTRAYGDKVYVNPASLLQNQFDVVGNTSPSAVSNSQWHVGTDVRVFIEDQPLYRGGIAGAAVLATFANFDIKLLVDGYATKDFGDTHSLVLLVDSLNVQNTLLQMLPEGQRSTAASTLNQILLAASNLRRVDGALLVGSDQGKAEGDVLENVLNALADLALGPDEFTPLKGSPHGGTWSRMTGPTGYSGRDDFYSLLKQIQDSTFFMNAVAGRVTLQLAAVSADMANQAHNDFGAFAALYSLSPFALTQGGTALESTVGELWGETYTQWKADKVALASGDSIPALTFTDEWLRDRAALLVRKNYFNVNDTSYDSTRPDAYAKTDSLGNAIATAFDSEDFVWHDRQTEMKVQRGGLTANTRYVVFGSDEDETDVIGGSRNDSLYGGGGNDVLRGHDGDDHLEGNEGNDSLDGGTGYDVLLGGAGDDNLVGGQGHDLLVGGAGDDTYYFEGKTGLDIIRDSDGVGRIILAGGQILSGGNKLADDTYVCDDSSIAYVRVGSDLVIRTTGAASGFITVKNWQPGQLGITLSDTPASSVTPTTTFNGDFVKLKNEAQAQYVLGSDGNYQSAGPQPGAPDLITGTSGADAIHGHAGHDALLGRDGDDLIDGGAGHDILMGGLGADTLIGGAGNDLIYGSAHGSLQYPLNDGWTLFDAGFTVLAEGWNWRSYTDFSRDIWGVQRQLLSPTVVRDEQFNDAGNVIDGGSGEDRIFAGTGNDVVHGGADNDYILGMGGHDVLFGDGGDDVILGDGTVALDPVTSTPAEAHGNDVLYGGDGNDVLIGQGASDVLIGGIDNDVLFGDDYDDARTPLAIHGDDLLDGGDGDDVLYGGGGDDILIGGKGNDHLVGGTGRDIYIFNKGDGVDWIIDTKSEGNIVRFGAGVNRDDVKLHLGSLLVDLGGGDQLHIDGFNQDDARGSVAIDRFEFADGSVLTSDALLDRGFDLYGGGQDDTVRGTSVDDRIRGLAGNDLLAGMAGDDWLDGGDGDDELQGGDGDDTLNGGSGNDRLYGQDGNDVYFFSVGSGHDLVKDTSGVNVFSFGEGILTDAIGVSLVNGMLVLTTTPGDSVTIDGQVAEYRFADGTVLNHEDIVAKLPATQEPDMPARITGTQDNDTLTGGAAGDYIFGMDGDDLIDGGAGDDFMFGEGGHDTMHGGAGADALVGGAGNDVLHGNAGSDRLWGNAGDDSLYGGDGDDELTAGDGTDLLVGGRGNDLLMSGGLGNKTYHFDLGDGNDVVALTSAARRIQFGAGILPGNIKVFQSPAGASPSYVVVQYSATDTVLIQLGSGSTPDYRFNDGTVLTHANLLATRGQASDAPRIVVGTAGNDTLSVSLASTVGGGAGNDRLNGSSFGDVLLGGSGDDLLYGNDGDDTLTGGPGHDTLMGGAGDDIYLYAAGDGCDTIFESGTPGEANVLRFTDLNAADVDYTREANGSLLIHLKTMVDVIEIQDWYAPTPRRLRIEYADGSSIEPSAFDDLAQSRIVATTHGAELTGTPDADIIEGSPGDDTIDGGGGDDELYGGAGKDTYQFRWSDMGIDTVYETAGDTNTLKLPYQMHFSDLAFERQGNDLYVHIEDARDGFLLKDYFSGLSSWNISTEGGITIALQDVATVVPPRRTFANVDELRAHWIATESARLISALRRLGAVNPEDGARIQQTTQYSDEPDIRRITRDWTTENEVMEEVLVMVRLSTSRWKQVVDNNVQLVVDWGTLDNEGRPVQHAFNPDGTVSGVTTTRYERATSWMSVKTKSMMMVRADTLLNLEHVVSGSSSNIISWNGFATIDAGAGNDFLWAWYGTFQNYGGQFLYGGDGDDFILAWVSNSLIVGGNGNDYLAGGAWDQTYYLFGQDTGTKIIDEVSLALEAGQGIGGISFASAYSNNDKVEFGDGISLDSLSITRGRYNSPYASEFVAGQGYVNGIRTFDTLDFSWGQDRTARVMLDPFHWYSDVGIEYFKFADGTMMSMYQMEVLLNSHVQRTFNLWQGDGAVTLELAPGIDSVKFGYGIAAHEVAASRDGADLVLLAGSGSDEWRLLGWFNNPANLSSFTFKFADGTTRSPAYFLNDAPALQAPLPDTSVLQDHAWTFTVPPSTFFDAEDGEVLAYSADLASGEPLPAWLRFETATGTFAGRPGNEDVGELELRITASDSQGLSATAAMRLTIVNVNDAPVAAQPLPAQSALTAKAWTYTFADDVFFDVDAGGALSYSATLAGGRALPAWLRFDEFTRTFSGTPGAADVGVVSLVVSATDLAGAKADQALELVVSRTSSNVIMGTTGSDQLLGGPGPDRLDGLGGADIMRGGAGDDTYVVDNRRDTVIEATQEGYDRIESSVSYTLPANVESIWLTGERRLRAVGNSLDNEMVGNSSANKLDAGAGDDVLRGMGGNDRLNGGLGADTYLFGRGDGHDTIVDFDATPGVQDVLRLGSDISADQLWLRRAGRNLEISVIGTADKVTISGWYRGSDHHVEIIELANGQQLLDSQVQNLVDAMAGFAPPPAGHTTLSPTYQSQLGGVIAANWQ